MRKMPCITCSPSPAETWTPATPVVARALAPAGLGPQPILAIYRKPLTAPRPRHLVDPWQGRPGQSWLTW